MDSVEPRCFGNGEKPSKSHNVDKVVLELFWKLAEGNDAERIEAAEKLHHRLVENKNKDAEGAVSQQKYCLQRLIRGMASSRKFARVGYAMALTKLLREMNDIKVKKVVGVIAEELRVSATDHKSEIGSKLLGRVFAYGAVIQSDRILKAAQLTSVVTELLAVGERKSYIRPSVTTTLVDLIQRVQPDVLRETVWPQLQEDMDKGWEECSPDRLVLLMACRNRDSTLVDKAYLKAHWGGAKVMGKKNYDNILQLLRRSVDQPQLQSVLLEVIAEEVTRKVSEDMDDLKDFWTKVGNPLLASTVPRKQVALALFCQLLERVTDIGLAEAMLFPGVAAVVVRSAERKDDPLLEVCTKAELLVVEACKKSEASAESLLAIVKGFLQASLRSKMHSFLRSTTLSTLVGALQAESVPTFTQLCMDCMMGRGELITQTDEKEDVAKQVDRFCQPLVPLLRVGTLNSTVQQSGLPLSVLQFLFLHTFFKVTKPTKSIPHCQEVSPAFSPSLRNSCQATFYRTLKQLLSTKPMGVSQQDQLMLYVQVLSDLAAFAQKLLSNSGNIQPVKEISDEVKEEWQKVMEVVASKTAKKGKAADSKLGETETFSLLILHLAFELFVEPESTTELLQDIYVCRQKAAKKQKAKQGSEGEPDWVEVMTEILLSMLSRASRLARVTTVAVFRSLTAHLTPGALHLVTQVLKDVKSKKDDPFEFEDIKEDMNDQEDDDEEKSDEEDEDDDDDENKEEEMPSDDDSDDDDDDDDDDAVDEDLRRSVKAALGSAAVASDEEDEDDDLDDDEMMKFDDQLAAAFRAMKKPSKKEKTEKRREVASFRLRALDLIEVIVKGDRCGDFAAEILEPLLKLVILKFKNQQNQGQQADIQQLCNRATELFHNLCKQRNLADSVHDKDELLEVTGNLLTMAQTGSNPQAVKEIASGCLCIMRLMSHQPATGPSPVKTRASRGGGHKDSPPSLNAQADFVKAIQDALEEDLLKRKNTKFNMAFFTAMIQKYPQVFWPLVTTVLTCLQSAETKVHTKTLACSLLVEFVHHIKRDAMSEEQWSLLSGKVASTLKKLVMQQQKDTLKPRLVMEVFNALYHICQRSTVAERKLLLTGELLAYMVQLKPKFNKDTRRVHNQLTQLLVQSKEKQAKKRKLAEDKNPTTNGTNGTPQKKKKHKQSSKPVQNGN